ncbi:MAG: lytic transglycosylase domain-containing protein [Candidatus Acidiferrales bacterium]
MALCLSLLAFWVAAAPPEASGAAEVIVVVNDKGRPVYINEEDAELRRVARAGGAAAALNLMEKRKQSMPGIEGHIDGVARVHEVDPALVRAVIEVESAWNPRAVSHKGAQGLMQLMPATAARYGVRNVFDPKENVSGGVRHLRFLLDLFNGDTRLALAAYNAGENAVTRYKGVPPYSETRAYIQRLETLYGTLKTAVGFGRIYRTVDARGRVVFENE